MSGALPQWPAGTVAVLATTGGGAPHAIPVSTARRAGDRAVVLALARSRGSLERLRADSRCALTVLAAGDVAFTARGRARVVAESLPGAENVVAVLLEVDEVRDHGSPRFAIEDGTRWSWADDEAAERDAAVHRALADVARRAPGCSAG